MIILVLVLMILGHLIADYPLQGWLAQAKQKSWWEKNAPDAKYKHDYIPALVCHGVMWSIIMFAPIMWVSYETMGWFWLALPVNIVFHCIVDDLKANKHCINLIQDQLLHVLQIIATWVWWFILVA